ncbi:acyl-CoA-binding domain-containing protein 4 isoform X8 [Monodon monoceros]|uniref:acyl-CoA-binding domain-containing protein 4 isoform X8 n=1 Tax=Monodon monoceros TaxID=40151 RepID=UPI0010F5E456|nr:acyl-CoA-binding domain-containing protein 4 isoform X8 [Monodon monoceros]XP_029067430.1 acyl-CoA-binding domain-containing protein 4 isoform X8 [Monodon monoceros]XP_029067431.1 acyl-CoA-binding domain-containing protein 4 isoform X8 [Monodon monoceros]
MKIQSRTARNSSRPQDAWNSLGKMSREQAMSAYVTEMKLVAQRVIDTVPLGEVAEDMFGYFEPLYQVIPDMPRPPETFLKRVTGWKEQVLNGDAEPAPEPPCLPKEPAPPSPESQPPRDQDSEVFCDSMEQLEPELQVGAEQRGALGGELNTRNSTESPAKKGRLESTLLGPQELDTWLVGTVRALQESMRDVQGRLQSLESMPVPRKQPLLSLSPRLCLLTPLPSPENVVARGAGKEVRGSAVMLPAWNWERPSFPALISLCLKSN